jgi:hypothetical protein
MQFCDKYRDLRKFEDMKKDSTIVVDVCAEEGSKLEKVVAGLLNDIDANRARLREEFRKKKQKQLKKIERRRL